MAGLIAQTPCRSTDQSALESTFRTALADPQFLPDGGLVGFGLRHEYSGKLIPSQLKGSDAALFSVCERLLLASALHIVYIDSRHTYVMCDVRRRYC